MNKVTFKKDFIIAEMYEDLKKMRIERKIDKILDSLSELSYSMISGSPGSGAGTGVSDNRPIRKGPSAGAGTGVAGAGYPVMRRSEDMDNEPEGNESFIEDNPPDEGKESISVSSRPYDHPLKAGSNLSVEQTFPGFMSGEFTDDQGIESISNKVGDDENEEWESSDYDDGPAEEDNDQKLENNINTVPNQKADELYNDIKDEMLGEMVDEILENNVNWKGAAIGAVAGAATGMAVTYAVAKRKCKDVQDPEKKKNCISQVLKYGVFHKPNTEGLQGPGGKFGFMGEEGYKGTMGEDSNSSEEK